LPNYAVLPKDNWAKIDKNTPGFFAQVCFSADLSSVRVLLWQAEDCKRCVLCTKEQSIFCISLPKKWVFPEKSKSLPRRYWQFALFALK